jgi:cytochrome c-type biogenesis protein CcmE
MRAKFIIGGIIIVVFIIWGASAFLKTTIQYIPLDQALKSKQTVQVLGKIDFSRVNYNNDMKRLEFAIYDEKTQDTITAVRMPVYYYGVVPGNFDQATSVVLKGKGSDSIFVAEQMLVKCPSKYQGSGGEYQDYKKHEQATANKDGR